MLWPHRAGHCSYDPTLLVYAIITQNASLNAAPSFVQYYKLAVSTSAGPHYQQRSDVLRYIEAEEAGEPKYSIHETRGEEELGMVKEGQS